MAEIVNDETLHMYVQESKEHLENIESDLLEIEQQGEALDEEVVNRVFRAAHSIKGGGGFLNLLQIKELAHKIENVLDMIRHRQLVPTSAVVSTLLESFDHLGHLLDNVLESNELDIALHVSRLEAVVTGGLQNGEKASLHDMRRLGHPAVPHLFEVSAFDLNQAGQNGRVFYVLEIDLLKDVHRKNLGPLDILSRLEDGGVILDITVGLAAVGSLEDEELLSGIPMFLLYASIIEPDLLPMVLDLSADQVHALGDLPALAAQAAPVPAAPAPAAAPASMPVPAPTPSVPPAQRPAAAGSAPAPGKEEPGERAPAGAAQAESSLRVNVTVLDQLMNRAGELVLARNQLMQAISSGDREEIQLAGQRLNLVTSELQETIMMTRMQPVGNIFNKFPRVVRDLARQLGKEIELTLEGKEVELDKTIIEGLGDPLTHLVRNAADHGIELPAVRQAKGKEAVGRITLRAHHESGQVIIEIQDDGKGIDPERIAQAAIRKGLVGQEQAQAMSENEKVNLIMLPGFSTAEQVTEVSGRGVGMDVVKTNLDKLGGQVELLSTVDRGSCIRIKLPLTLAIIPSLLVVSGNGRFAIPQVNVAELLRIPAAEVRGKIEKVGDAEVLTLRGELVPLVQLGSLLGLKRLFFDAKLGRYREDRRVRIADERLRPEGGEAAGESRAPAVEGADAVERRQSRESDVNIAIVQAGANRYGLVVDELRDNVEIVVKPLGRHLKHCEAYAGATIMGDGYLALILDVAGMARKADLRALAEASAARQAQRQAREKPAARETLLLFQNGPGEHCAVPLAMVLRVEKIRSDAIRISGGKKVIEYRGGTLQVYALEEVARVAPLEDRAELIVLVFPVAGREVGLLAAPPLDAVELEGAIDEDTLRQPGIRGSAIVRGQTTLMVDLPDFMRVLHPQWFAAAGSGAAPEEAGGDEPPQVGQPAGSRAVLLVEDSDFFRHQVGNILAEAGLPVVPAENGQVAWEYLDAHPEEIGLVVTDIEMPVLDGIGLSSRLRGDGRFGRLPVLALTSLARPEDIARGAEAGIDEYQIKMDREKLLRSVWQLIRHGRKEEQPA
ncbi:MAG: hybrid sensor histidine kinase/response regulator [Thermodesulfobacteriota bacterium]